MTYFFVALALWAAGCLLLPVTFWLKNARNWPGLILLHNNLSVPGSIWAKEYYEARQAWRLLPVHVALILVGRIYPPWAAYERRREIMGHEIEVWAEAALVGGSTYWIRAREAAGLATYPAFTGYLADEIEQLMRGQTGAAQRFVSKHMAKIEKKQRQ